MIFKKLALSGFSCTGQTITQSSIELFSDSTFSITPTGATPNTKYTWNAPSSISGTSQTIPQNIISDTVYNYTTGQTSGTYSVRPYDNNGCYGNDFTFNVTVNPIPQSKYFLINPGNLQYSTDSGNTFNSSTIFPTTVTGRRFRQVAMSNDGQYQYVAANGSGASGLNLQRPYVSSNYGVNFDPLLSFSGRWWNTISCSKNGQYVLATSSDASTAGGTTYSIFQKSSNYGAGATTETLGGLINGNNTNKLNGGPVGLSNDGQFQTIFLSDSSGLGGAGSHAISSDYGANFTVYSASTFNIEIGGGSTVAISDNGQYQLGNSNGLIVSSNSGVTWTQKYTGATYNAALSSDGQYQYATTKTGTGVLISSNYGSSFSLSTGITSDEIQALDCNNSGQIVYISTYNSIGGTYKILVSTNYGQTWRVYNASSGGAWMKVSN